VLRYSTHCREISQFYPHTHTFIYDWNEPYLPLSSQSKLVLIYRLRGMDSWVGLGTTTVSKQSLQDRYETAIAVVSCSDSRTSQGNWNAVDLSIEPLTSWAMSHYANHWVTELRCLYKFLCSVLVATALVWLVGDRHWNDATSIAVLLLVQCNNVCEYLSCATVNMVLGNTERRYVLFRCLFQSIQFYIYMCSTKCD